MATTPAPGITPTLSPGEWKVDSPQSTLEFKTRVMGLMSIKGIYSEFDGTLNVDASGGATGHLRVAADKLSTGIKKRDVHLRSKDFFDTDAHPHMTFDLASLQSSADGSARLLGTLHIRDHNLPIDAKVSLNPAGGRTFRIEGSFEIDHRSAGFEFKRLPRRVQIEASLMLKPTS